MTYFKLIPVAGLICLLSLNCGVQEKSREPLSSELFEEIYIQLLDSNAVAPPSADTTLSSVAQRVLMSRGVTAEQFKATVAYYNSDTQRWREFYSSIVRRYDERNLKPPDTTSSSK